MGRGVIEELNRPVKWWEIVHAIALLSSMLIVGLVSVKLVPWLLFLWLIVDTLFGFVWRFWKLRRFRMRRQQDGGI
jgi:hypothetical protein